MQSGDAANPPPAMRVTAVYRSGPGVPRAEGYFDQRLDLDRHRHSGIQRTYVCKR